MHPNQATVAVIRVLHILKFLSGFKWKQPAFSPPKLIYTTKQILTSFLPVGACFGAHRSALTGVRHGGAQPRWRGWCCFLPFLPSSAMLDHEMDPAENAFGLLLVLICQVTFQRRLLPKEVMVQLDKCLCQPWAAVGRGGWGRVGLSFLVAAVWLA